MPSVHATTPNSDSIIIQRKLLSYSLNSGLLITNSRNTVPYWLRTNQYGIIPNYSPSIILESKIASDFTGRKWDWGFGLETFANLGPSNHFNFSEGYLKGRWGLIEVWGGRRKQTIGLVGDSTLTSGSYVESGNALPIPLIQIGFQDYVPVLHGLFAIKGHYAHGWFDSNPIVRNHYLHQKTLYGRFGKPHWKIILYGGFNHNVQWGGKYVIKNQPYGRNQNPSDWIDYFYVITGKYTASLKFVDPTKYDVIDHGNRIGNHLGSVDVGAEFNTNKWKVIAYRQSIYDDGSLFKKTNLADGLHGISIKARGDNYTLFGIKGVTVEFLNTTSQGGALFTAASLGRDNYFNHAQFYGWVYGGNTVGTPFLSPSKFSSTSLPNRGFTNNNRVRLFHLSFNGRAYGARYLLKASYSNNLGTYDNPFPHGTNQFSLLADLSGKLPWKAIEEFDGFAKVGVDLGKLYPNATGIYFGIRKNGVLKMRK